MSTQENAEGPQVEAAPQGAPLPPDPAPVPTDWSRLHLWQIQPVRDLLVVALVLLIVYLGYVLSPITVPVLLALALAYLVEPVVLRMTRTGRVGRPLAAAGVIAALIIIVVVPLTIGIVFAVAQALDAAGQARGYLTDVQTFVKNPESDLGQEAVERLPRGWQWIAHRLEELDQPGIVAPAVQEETPAGQGTAPEPSGKDVPGERVGSNPGGSSVPSGTTQPGTGEPPTATGDGGDPGQPAAVPPTVVAAPTEGAGIIDRVSLLVGGWLDRNASMVSGVVGKSVLWTGADAARLVLRIVGRSAYLGFAGFLTLFFFFFFCVNYDRVRRNLASLIPQWKRERVLSNLRQMDSVIAAFIRGRMTIALILIVLYSIGFVVIGVPGGLVLGLCVGAASLIPYLALTGVPVAILLLWLHPSSVEWQTSWWWVLGAPCITYFIIQATDDYIWTPLIQGKATQLDTPSILFAVLAGGVLAGFYGVLIAIPTAACLKIMLRESFWPRFRAWSDGKVRDFLPISRYVPPSAVEANPPQGPGAGGTGGVAT